MKPDEAIQILEVAKAECEWNAPLDYQEAFDMAISALQEQEEPKPPASGSVTCMFAKKMHDRPTDDCVSRQEAIDALERNACNTQRAIEAVEALPSAQPEWNNHTVACLLAELFDDTCACNYNGIDEWLPEKCELLDSCPNPVGVACWEQFLKYRAERRTDEAD